MNQTFQEKNRIDLSLPSGRFLPMNLAPMYAAPKRTISPKGFNTMAQCQGSIGKA